jgi:hypothetical protein
MEDGPQKVQLILFRSSNEYLLVDTVIQLQDIVQAHPRPEHVINDHAMQIDPLLGLPILQNRLKLGNRVEFPPTRSLQWDSAHFQFFTAS